MTDDACPTCGPICGMREFSKRYGAELDDEDLRRIGEARKRMTDFTPTTHQVRDAYVRAMRNAFIASTGEHREEFDRWLQNARKNAAADEHQAWVEAVHALDTIRAEYARYQTTGDLHELARAIGQIINGPGDGDE